MSFSIKKTTQVSIYQVSIYLGFILVFSSSGAQTTSQRLEQLQQSLSQQNKLTSEKSMQLESIKNNIQNLNAKQKQSLVKLDQTAENLNNLEKEVSSLNEQVTLSQRQLKETTSQLTLSEARVSRLQVQVRGILREMYEKQGGNYLELLSQATSYSELMARLQYSNMANRRNTEVIKELKTEVKNLETQKASQLKQMQVLIDLRTRRNTTLVNLKDKKTEQENLLAELRKTQQGQQALAAKRQAELVLVSQTINDLVVKVSKEKARLEAERQRRILEEQRRIAEQKRIEKERQAALAAAQARARENARRLAEAKALQAQREAAARLEAQKAREAKARAEASAQKAEAERAAAELRRQQELEANAAQNSRRIDLQQQQQRQQQQKLDDEQVLANNRNNELTQNAENLNQQLLPLPTPTGPLGYPVSNGRIMAAYGTNGLPWVVFGGPDNTNAIAAQAGKVIAVTSNASLGWIIIIDHTNIETCYMGLQSPQVSVGDRVNKGTPLGTLGGSPVFGPAQMAFQVSKNKVSFKPNF